MNIEEKLQSCLESFRQKTNFIPVVGIILGSGLGDFADRIDVETTVDYNDIKNFPVSTVEGHKGRFVLGYVEGVPVVAMQGRVHYYEGYDMSDVVLPTRLMARMGAKALLLTNAAGGINYAFSAGDFMMIDDHISSFVPSPLIGPNFESLGLRFPDMTDVYDRRFREKTIEVAASKQILLRRGVYVQLSGPQFETPAEIRALRSLGADAAGMSTACEAIAARHMGLRVAGISCISNMAAGMTGESLTHIEVQETADRVAPLFQDLVCATLKMMGQEVGHSS